MSEGPVVEALVRQFARAWGMLREAIDNCPEDQWRVAHRESLIPARLALHVVESVDFHTGESPEAFDRHTGANWETSPVGDLSTRSQLVDDLDKTRAETESRLRKLGDDGLTGPDASHGYFPSALDHALYTMRHLQHHIGELNAELKRRGLPPGKWV